MNFKAKGKIYNHYFLLFVMPYQCVRCSKIIESGSREIIDGCEKCKSHFFFYIKESQIDEMRNRIIEIPQEEKKKVEKDIREIAGIKDPDSPVILDIESVRVTGEGKFELDLVKLLKKDQPLIYKLEEGKYIIDLASTMKKSAKDIKEIQDFDK